MIYNNLVQGFIIQLAVVPPCAAIIFVLIIMFTSKYFTSYFVVDIVLNVGIFTFPLSWLIGFYMIYNTYILSKDTYNLLWHGFPFAVVFTASILVGFYIKFIKKSPKPYKP